MTGRKLHRDYLWITVGGLLLQVFMSMVYIWMVPAGIGKISAFVNRQLRCCSVCCLLYTCMQWIRAPLVTPDYISVQCIRNHAVPTWPTSQLSSSGPIRVQITGYWGVWPRFVTSNKLTWMRQWTGEVHKMSPTIKPTLHQSYAHSFHVVPQYNREWCICEQQLESLLQLLTGTSMPFTLFLPLSALHRSISVLVELLQFRFISFFVLFFFSVEASQIKILDWTQELLTSYWT